MEAPQSSSLYWKPFSLTHVTYPVVSSSSTTSSISSNVLPSLLALLSLAPPFGTCGLFVSSIFHRDVVSTYLLVGVLLAVSLTSIMKSIIRHPRPPRYDDDDGRAREYGMPSNHSCFVWFVAAFAMLYVTRREGGMAWSAKSLQSRMIRHPSSTCDAPSSSSSSSSSSSPSTSSSSSSSSSTHPPRQDVVVPSPAAAIDLYRRMHTTFAISSSLLIAIGCSYSRVYLGYHTTPQVLVGSVLGTSLGIGWNFLLGTGRVRALLIRADAFLDDLERNRRNDLLVGMAGGGYASGGESPGRKRV
ncbi:hypothetical protein ACHAXA_002688 [Cyclostephanos tholiformis]|uniref:Phosphatidic acid phosphatase type 2/haloperoxidase domain-containing protein n=1 Tax=Cyclostephanos tholiformis TaxID=382380 RepID=A0ABD3S038_9STRA